MSFPSAPRLSYCIISTLLKQTRKQIHMGRVVPEIDHKLGEEISDGSLNPKHMQSRRNNSMARLPVRLRAVAEDILRSYGDRQFRSEVIYLIDVLKDLKLPDDTDTLKVKKAEIKTQLELRDKTIQEAYHDSSEQSLPEEQLLARDLLQHLILGSLFQQRRDWHYYEYDQRAALMYMAARLAPNYSCIGAVMKEIRLSDPSFSPRSVLDFGSGMGTTYWAVESTWPQMVSEYMNIEISKEQQYLAERLMRNGRDIGETPPGVFHKQYLPASDKVKYDMVVAAFSLLELPTKHLRASVIENLWHKTNDLLVIIERGNKGGFTIVNEARNFILDLSGHDVTGKLNFTLETRPIFKHTIPSCHVLAPCSHEFACPRTSMSSKKRMDICRFKTFYLPLEFGLKGPGMLAEEYSYVVLRKRPHPIHLSSSECSLRWPRIVERRGKTGKQVVQKLCCPNGALATATVTKAKYGKATYEAAKASDWGDIFPVKVCDTYVSKNVKPVVSNPSEVDKD